MRAPCSSAVLSSLNWVAQDFHRSGILVSFLFQCKRNLLFELALELQPSLNSSVTSCVSFLQGEDHSEPHRTGAHRLRFRVVVA